ncbi:acyltransferase family protein [Alloyangia pacifica]|uniref:acyltransferase family protein n=1 Tax=Alloyangia pacifica TaxID=311180 RepID=UPI001CFD9986|nr:acyltransferase [Alloyangia pacifica]
MTIDDLMAEARGRPSGFDYMRLILSVLVLTIHSVQIAYGHKIYMNAVWAHFPLDGLAMTVLPMFFTLSGFLVAGSLYRCRTLLSFMGLRFIRIYPALAVEVTISALLIGPLVTSLHWSEYFTSAGFFRYLFNVTGHVSTASLYLPGTFEANPEPGMANGQLWTVPYELICYIGLAVIALMGGRKDRRVLLLGLLSFTAFSVFKMGLRTGWDFDPWVGPVTGRALVIAFLCGICLHAYRDKVQIHGYLVAIAGAVAVIAFSLSGLGQYVGLAAIAYVTVGLGLMNLPRLWVLKSADLSYGIFLYHFIIQQLIAHLLPGLREWYWIAMISLPVSMLVAHLSWVGIERPALKLRQRVFALECKIMRSLPGLSGWHAPAER